MERLTGRPLVSGSAEGTALVAEEPLSFWGGVDPATGEVIDRRHHLSGQTIGGRVLVVPYSRGSSTTSTVLLETIRVHTAPAAIISSSVDSMLALGPIVADELHHRTFPVIALEGDQFRRIQTGDRLVVHPDGTIERDPVAKEEI